MNLHETGMVLDVLETAYPRMFSGPGSFDRQKTLGLWAKMFADDDAAVVAAAAKCFIAGDTKGFAPSIGQLKNIMLRLRDPGGLDEDQAWELIRKAASNSGYGAREEYERLPEDLRRICSPGQLYEWSQMDSDVFNSVVGSNFRRSWRARLESRRRDALLPADVKQALAGAAERMALGDGT